MKQKSKDKRFESDDEFDLEDVIDAMETTERVRIARDAIPVTQDSWENTVRDLDEIAGLMLVTDYNSHIAEAVLYDPENGVYAVVSGHTRSEAWNNAEYDWKVRSVGTWLKAEWDSDDFDEEWEWGDAGEEWTEWFIGETIKGNNTDGIYSVKPGMTVTVVDSSEGLKGDSFSVKLTAER